MSVDLEAAVASFTAALDAHSRQIEHGPTYVDDDKETVVAALLAYGWRPPVQAELVLAPGQWDQIVTDAVAALAARYGVPLVGQATVSRPLTPPRPAGPSVPPPERDQ